MWLHVRVCWDHPSQRPLLSTHVSAQVHAGRGRVLTAGDVPLQVLLAGEALPAVGAEDHGGGVEDGSGSK